MVDRQRPHDGVLGQVGVLVFVDQDIAVALVELAAHLGVLAEQRGDVQQQIVEIDGVRRRPASPDRPDRLCDDAAQRVARRGWYCSAVIRLFLAQLMARGDPSGEVNGRIDLQLANRPLAGPAGCRTCRRSCSFRPARRCGAYFRSSRAQKRWNVLIHTGCRGRAARRGAAFPRRPCW